MSSGGPVKWCSEKSPKRGSAALSTYGLIYFQCTSIKIGNVPGCSIIDTPSWMKQTQIKDCGGTKCKNVITLTAAVCLYKFLLHSNYKKLFIACYVFLYFACCYLLWDVNKTLLQRFHFRVFLSFKGRKKTDAQNSVWKKPTWIEN